MCWSMARLPLLTVRVDGDVLPKLSAADFGSMPGGWEVDPAGNRLVIRLPSRQVEHSERTTEIEVDFSRG